MPKYIVFIYDDEAALGSAGAEAIGANGQSHQKFAEKHGQTLRGGGRLAPSTGTVTIRDGESATEPFAKSPDQIGGYYIIEADDAAQAAEIAKDVPAPWGGVEVRELV
jgi:hypothetical protein